MPLLKKNGVKVPTPNVIPEANARKLTDRLFVMMWLVSFGATLTMESVHILCCSIVAIIAGPTKWRINSGRAVVSAAPSSPHPIITSSDIATYGSCR